MAKVKQESGEPKAKKESPPKGPGRSDLIAEATQKGTATFVFDDPQMESSEFVSYNGGKGRHAFCVIRNDGKKLKSGRTGLGHLKVAEATETCKTLLDLLKSQSKRGRPPNKKEPEPSADKEVPKEAEATVEPGDVKKEESTSAFAFMDDGSKSE